MHAFLFGVSVEIKLPRYRANIVVIAKGFSKDCISSYTNKECRRVMVSLHSVFLCVVLGTEQGNTIPTELYPQPLSAFLSTLSIVFFIVAFLSKLNVPSFLCLVTSVAEHDFICLLAI